MKSTKNGLPVSAPKLADRKFLRQIKFQTSTAQRWMLSLPKDRIQELGFYLPPLRHRNDSGAVRHSIHGREDEHRDAQDYADLLQPGASLSLIWQE